MIEIAISLAIIGFALTAIILILPVAMSGQKKNREETIINQEASVFLDAIRNGRQGIDDLTNYIMAITNSFTRYDFDANGVPQPQAQHVYGYTYDASTIDRVVAGPQYPITNGFTIVGLLSTPKYITDARGFGSNHVVAFVRSLSGAASDKYPQADTTVRDLAFSYRMISDVVPYEASIYNPLWPGTNNSGALAARTTYAHYATNLQNNLHDVRLTFRWPLLPNGDAADTGGRQVYRAMVSGVLTNDLGSPPFFFFHPQTYVSAP